MSFYSPDLPDEHEDCGYQWECWQCGKSVCSRCEHSPGEFTECTACFEAIGKRPA